MKKIYFIVVGILLLFVMPFTSSFNFETGGVKIIEPVESNGAIPVNIQDQHTPAFDIFFSQSINRTSLDSIGTVDNYTITTVTGHGIQIGEQLVLYDSSVERAYVGDVLDVVVNLITLDTPLNSNFSVNDTTIARTTKDLNVDGSTTRQTFIITTPISQELDITRIMFQIITSSATDLNKFGNIANGLDRGLVVRIVNGRTTNLFNVKTNGDLINLMYDVNFYDASNPGQGVYGLGGRLTYGGQNKHGVTLRIEPGDTIEVIIQDDLSSLVSFRMIASGHIVTD